MVKREGIWSDLAMVGKKSNAAITEQRGDQHIERCNSVRYALHHLRLPAETAGVFQKVTHICIQLSRAGFYGCSLHHAAVSTFGYAR